jgi:hypothetical protein
VLGFTMMRDAMNVTSARSNILDYGLAAKETTITLIAKVFPGK